MPQFYLYTNIIGSYVFDQKFFMIDKVIFKDNEILANSNLIEQGRFIPAEKSLITKHRKGNFIVIGPRTESFEGIKSSLDDKTYEKITLELKKDRSVFERLRHHNTILTKDKIRHAVNEDTVIMQTISSVMELEKIINTIAKRLREWYSYYLPEFSKSIQDHEKFAELIARKSREDLMRELNLRKDESMGGEFRKEDIEIVVTLAKNLSGLYRLKEQETMYLERMMKDYCPNMQAVAGTLIAAKLLGKAGSLKRLVEFPSSTIQVLGAEEAFFRHMTTGSRMPKHGYISQHEFMSKAPMKDHGRIARALADKISIAVKVDYFKGKFVGDMLRKKVEEKLKPKNESKKDKKEFGRR
ncbi:hypothetical protein COV19_07245 [Candidatus Woesearchaeota archaeon CG10_big_fil_rev_8_21_14_0_10_44_13]|nr:MAG: hypothetical protein COV19_07245 [Candidatus Woesearchaeota archaeon CG10_big_fil_rev_8_21_14_0_10_44_13]